MTDQFAAPISARSRVLWLLGFCASLAFGCDDAAQMGGEAWHHARDFVKVEPGTMIYRTCGVNNEKDESFEVVDTRCILADNVIGSDGSVTNAVTIQSFSNGGISATYIGEELGIQTGSDYGRGMTAAHMHTPNCGGDSFASTPHCSVELVHLERSEEPWSGPAGYDEASSVTLRVSCPEELVGHFGDHTSPMRQTPTHLEFHATRCAVIHYPHPREGDAAQEE